MFPPSPHQLDAPLIGVRQLLQIVAEVLTHLLPNPTTDLSDRTDVEGARVYEIAASDDIELCTPPPYVYVEEGVVISSLERTDQIGRDQLCLLPTADDLDAYACLLLDLLDQLETIICVTHCRGSAGSEGDYLVDLHQLTIGLHEADELLSFLLGYMSLGKGIFT